MEPHDESSDIPVHRPDGVRLHAGAPLTGTLPDGTAYNVPTYIPDANKVAAVGGGRLYTNYPDYVTKFNGIELAVNKRMSNRWMMRLGAAYSNPTEDYDANPPINEIGNPTSIDTTPVKSGGAFAPRSGGSGSGDVFINQKWNFNVNGAYQLPLTTWKWRATCSASRARRSRSTGTPRSAATVRGAC